MIGEESSVIASVPVTYYDAAFAASVVLTHPVLRLVVRAVSTLGAISAIVLLLRDSKVARRVAFALVVICVVLALSACSTTEEFRGRSVANTTVMPVSGVYCAEELEVYQDTLVIRLKHPDDPVARSEFETARDDYEECSTAHNADRVLVNPFNKIRGLGE